MKLVFKCISSDVMKNWLVDSSYKYTIKINAREQRGSISIYFSQSNTHIQVTDEASTILLYTHLSDKFTQ